MFSVMSVCLALGHVRYLVPVHHRMETDERPPPLPTGVVMQNRDFVFTDNKSKQLGR